MIILYISPSLLTIPLFNFFLFFFNLLYLLLFIILFIYLLLFKNIINNNNLNIIIKKSLFLFNIRYTDIWLSLCYFFSFRLFICYFSFGLYFCYFFRLCYPCIIICFAQIILMLFLSFKLSIYNYIQR